MSTDLTRTFEPGSVPEALEYAKRLFASRLLPKSLSSPEAVLVVIACGRELGMTAMQSIRSIHVIEGKPVLSADLIVALVKRSTECEFFRLVESTEKVATYETQRRGEPSPTRMSFTIDEAGKAGVAGKDNWRKYPAAMLRARCSAALARAVYPDVAMGLYDPDELEPTAQTRPAQVVALDQSPPKPPSNPQLPPHDEETGEVHDAPASTEALLAYSVALQQTTSYQDALTLFRKAKADPDLAGSRDEVLLAIRKRGEALKANPPDCEPERLGAAQ